MINYEKKSKNAKKTQPVKNSMWNYHLKFQD